ncbi:hypothetical protein TNCV_2859891 [Trichonephila clavipes]|nr:hypothetical protein TNCV_2859891 [Trichonephila clavipes]
MQTLFKYLSLSRRDNGQELIVSLNSNVNDWWLRMVRLIPEEESAGIVENVNLTAERAIRLKTGSYKRLKKIRAVHNFDI